MKEIIIGIEGETGTGMSYSSLYIAQLMNRMIKKKPLNRT